MKINKKPKAYVDKRFDKEERLAGGYGQMAAVQGAEALLRRAVLANLLWENMHYESGEDSAAHIRSLIPHVEPIVCASIAIEARQQQKLRHVPLLIAREMARIDTHKRLVGELLPQIILRADELSEFLAIYWSEGKCPISAQVKKGLAAAIGNFDAHRFAKYNGKKEVRLRDVMFLTHPKPPQGKEETFRQLANNELPTPDTWETALSSGADKKSTWERLITTGMLGALAFVRNLRNMEQVNVDPEVIRFGFANLKTEWLLPLNYLAAAKHAPRWMREIEECMLRGLSQAPKLEGHSVLVADVSGSMGSNISSKSDFTRMDACAAMAVLAAEMCESVSIYATAGSDYAHKHQTELIRPYRGFALSNEITSAASRLGGGGIFTRQCLEYIQTQEHGAVDRIMVFSDSQDCDHHNMRVPKPFGRYNYIVDVSAHKKGINYEGVWTAELSGWSEHFLKYIAALEGMGIPTQ